MQSMPMQAVRTSIHPIILGIVACGATLALAVSLLLEISNSREAAIAASKSRSVLVSGQAETAIARSFIAAEQAVLTATATISDLDLSDRNGASQLRDRLNAVIAKSNLVHRLVARSANGAVIAAVSGPAYVQPLPEQLGMGSISGTTTVKSGTKVKLTAEIALDVLQEQLHALHQDSGRTLGLILRSGDQFESLTTPLNLGPTIPSGAGPLVDQSFEQAQGTYAGRGLSIIDAVGAFQRSSQYPFAVFAEEPRWSALTAADSRIGATLVLLTLALLALVPFAILAWHGATRRSRLMRALQTATRQAQDTEARTRAFQHAAPDAMFSVNTSFRIIDWNRAAEGLFGWPRAEVVGRDALQYLVPRASRPVLKEMMVRFLQGSQYTHIGERIELTLLRAGGHELPVDVAVSIVKTMSGPVFTLHVRDTRAQREAADALRQSERHHRAVVDALHEIIFQTNRDGILTYLNLAWRRATRLSIEESLGRGLAEFVVPDDQAKLTRLIAALPSMASDSMALSSIELSLRTADNATRLMQLSAQPLTDADGRVLGLVGTFEDITEKRVAEIRLHDQLRFNQELIETIPIPVAVRNRESEFLAVNRAWEHFSGRNRDGVLGRKLTELFSSDHTALLVSAEHALVIDGGSTSFESQLRAADGSIRTVLNHKSAFANADGSRSNIITAFVDITDQKTAEAEVRAAKEVAEAANRAKNKFLADISHEIRQPLGGIIGMAELTLGTELSNEQRSYLQTMRASADTLVTVINDVLDFSKIESGQLEVERIRFDVRKVAGEAMRLVAAPGQAKGLEVLLSVQSTVPQYVVGDSNRLRQVLINLIGNAIRFTVAGEVSLSVTVASAGQLRFAVRDTGPGVPPHVRERLLRLWSRGENADMQQHSRSLLGLAIAQRLVRLLGGDRLELESAEGVGSTFTFVLPLETQGISQSKSFNLRALVAIDHASTAALTVAALGELGVASVCVANAESAFGALDAADTAASHGASGPEAEREAVNGEFDLMLVDLALSGGTGLDLVQAISKRAPQLRLVAMAPMSGPLARLQDPSIPELVQLRKPVIANELLAILEATEHSKFKSAFAIENSAPLPQLGSLESTERKLLPILVAEDHPVNQALVRRLLQRQGYEVVVVENGMLAVKAVALRQYAFILMDLDMPEMDGLEASRRIRLAEAHGLSMGLRRTPIIALTANAFDTDRENCREAGMDGYLAKPITAASLNRMLAEHAGPEDLARSAPARALDLTL